ncbi:MAG TPA: hypothetical protein VEQ63_00535 [Bryobacteraceae bacterium]|nr:hypothetical protein [Bryobacteraceae bacterium]
MLSFAEFAAESFESEVCLNWRLVSVRHAIATFTAGTVRVEVAFEQREDDGSWHAAGFHVTAGTAADGAAMAFRIFNGVFQAVREFVETREPAELVFTAKSDDLVSIYATYLRRERANMEQLGYALDGPVRVDPYTEFILRRIPPSNWKA